MAKSGEQRNQDALDIFLAGVAAVEPRGAVKAHLRRNEQRLEIGETSIDLPDNGRVFIIGAGKAAGPMAAAVEELLGERIAGGIAVTKYGHGVELKHTTLLEAGHPVPDQNGLDASFKIMGMLELAGHQDLVICLISGGGSALLPCPAEDLSLGDKMTVTQQLLDCGATIGEINTVRKHLSKLKGGGLARLAAPARLVTLILSDVVGDPLDVIASGPTVADPSTYGQALEILNRYGLTDEVPEKVRHYLEQGDAGLLDETPKPGEPLFSQNLNLLVGTNRLAVEAAAAKASDLGYHPLILSTTMTGETRHIAAAHAAMAREIIESGHPLPAPACLLSGGETTVTIKGKGKGGRNQEFALAAALEIEGLANVTILSGGTDGNDGPTDAAGAVVDGSTCSRARQKGLDPRHHLEHNDAYPFFQALGDLLITGPTNTNVMDLRLVLVPGEE